MAVCLAVAYLRVNTVSRREYTHDVRVYQLPRIHLRVKARYLQGISNYAESDAVLKERRFLNFLVDPKS